MRSFDLGLRTALIVTPVNVLHNWRHEFGKWAPSEFKPLRVFMLEDVPRFVISSLAIFLDIYVSVLICFIYCGCCYWKERLLSNYLGSTHLDYLKQLVFLCMFSMNCTTFKVVHFKAYTEMFMALILIISSHKFSNAYFQWTAVASRWCIFRESI